LGCKRRYFHYLVLLDIKGEIVISLYLGSNVFLHRGNFEGVNPNITHTAFVIKNDYKETTQCLAKLGEGY